MSCNDVKFALPVAIKLLPIDTGNPDTDDIAVSLTIYGPDTEIGPPFKLISGFDATENTPFTIIGP
jgi:hypothetical protein